ncbi:MAG: acylneuraminate cytidylyltransferase family protein, partial [Phycisphaerae bacterium]|nr:acylneuraminate cytidylyltransferase family protein [Phycisphaerae bacterium]
MDASKSIVVVIPARGGSKGVPQKNIRPLAGKPLIAHTIKDAQDSRLVNRVIVSTEDAVIASISKELGAEVIPRPMELANDAATSEAALLHTLDYLEEKENLKPDLVVFLQCTSPVRGSRHIDNAIKTLEKQKADSLLSVCKSHRFVWRLEDGVLQSINYDYQNRQRRQDLPPEYFENGSIYVFKPRVLREGNNRLGGKIAFYEMGP